MPIDHNKLKIYVVIYNYTPAAALPANIRIIMIITE